MLVSIVVGISANLNLFQENERNIEIFKVGVNYPLDLILNHTEKAQKNVYSNGRVVFKGIIKNTVQNVRVDFKKVENSDLEIEKLADSIALHHGMVVREIVFYSSIGYFKGRDQRNYLNNNFQVSENSALVPKV